jgi:hypothetical protein
MCEFSWVRFAGWLIVITVGVAGWVLLQESRRDAVRLSIGCLHCGVFW